MIDEAMLVERVNAFPFVKLMGLKLLSAKGGESVMSCRVKKILLNSMGTFNGGAMGAVVDISIAMALRGIVPRSRAMTTVEYKVNFLKPIPPGTITAYGKIVRIGKTIAVGTCDVKNKDGESVAFGSATFYLYPAAEEAKAVKECDCKKRKAGRSAK